jgi:dephospho-CoA kinase
LLFETEAQPHFDHIVCVACSPGEQQRRLSERGWTIDHIHERIAAQWPIEKKISASDFVVWTDGSLDLHSEQIDLILSKLRKCKAAPA